MNVRHQLVALGFLLATAACSGSVVPLSNGNDPPTVTLGSCTADWCVSDVLTAAGHDLQNAWASSASDAWVVDAFGNLLHWNGSAWSMSSTSDFTSVTGVWGTSATAVWAVGDGGVRFWDGAKWTIFDVPSTLPLQTVWGISANDVWVGGGGGTFDHWDGNAWSAYPSARWNEDVMAFWGSRSDDVWAVTDVGFTHWNGKTWSPPTQLASQIAEGMWGSAGDDVWAVGQFGMIAHYDGSAWTEISSGTKQDLHTVWGTSPNDVWAVGNGGTVVHFDGASWQPSASGVDVPLFGVHGTGPHDVWAVGMNVILHHGG